MGAADLVTAAVSLFLGAGGAAAVSQMVHRRKIGADATAVLTKAAAAMVDPLSTQLAKAYAQVEELREKVTEVTREMDRRLAEQRQLHEIEMAACRRRVRELESARGA